MDRHKIRTSKTDSVKAIATNQYVDVALQQTAKTLPYPNVSSTLSQMTVYEQERQAGNKFRLILTIVPYCSNVLFNPLTEIIKDEGSEKVTVVTDSNKAKITNALGLKNPDRIHMIQNTEYSSDLHGGFEYHPGYDFFDNHIMRNQSFKIVNPNKSRDRDVFNTLSDYTRDRSGIKQIFRKRLSIGDTSNLNNISNNKHLYLKDDILSIDDSINQNLFEENGWWGFTNNTTVDPKQLNVSKKKWESIDIGRALNNHKACEFIDMYPDRTLFSFSPKFNSFTHKNEYNWTVVLTYPYKNIYDHPICLGGSSYIKRTLNDNGDTIEETVSEGNRWMGLKVMNVDLSSSKSGGTNIVFRTYTKHGLSQGDTFYLYYTNPFMYQTDNEKDIDYVQCDKFGDDTLNGNEVYYESETYFKVTNVGDLSKNNEDYFFYTSNLDALKEIYNSFLLYARKQNQKNCWRRLYDDDVDKGGIYDSDGDLKEDLLSKLLRYTNFRIRRCVSGVKSTYYIRQFRKIPNLCAAQRKMTEEEALHKSKFNGVFDGFVVENALDPTSSKSQRLFKNETYQLAFASNIFNDNAAQITFTDGVDTENLTDNLGRQLSEIYYTVIKNNAGHEVWYNDTTPLYSNKDIEETYSNQKKEFKNTYGVDYDDYKIEYSHCFGKITSGFETFVNKNDTEETTAPIEYWKKLSSVHHIANVINTCDIDYAAYKDEISSPLEIDITYKDNFFYGDLVEFSPIDFKEKQISKVMHRFNTAQRETMNNEHYSQFQYHEITTDDYDRDNFAVTEYSAVNGLADPYREQKDFATVCRPEGYYYQAHYPIQIREFTRIQQGSHYTLRVRSAKPVQNDGILIQIKTSISHGLSANDIIFICDDDSNIWYVTKCVQVIDRATFLMSPNYDEYVLNATDFEDKENISNLRNLAEVSINEEGEIISNKNKNRYKNKFSWLELCGILNGSLKDDISYPTLTLRRKNADIPDYATYIGGNRYLWRNLVNIGDVDATELPNYVFANGYFYITSRINFYLKRQDPFGTNGLYFDGDTTYPCFPNDPSGNKQEENYYIAKDTETSC
jgi:hypothetical protein